MAAAGAMSCPGRASAARLAMATTNLSLGGDACASAALLPGSRRVPALMREPPITAGSKDGGLRPAATSSRASESGRSAQPHKAIRGSILARREIAAVSSINSDIRAERAASKRSTSALSAAASSHTPSFPPLSRYSTGSVRMFPKNATSSGPGSAVA
eukprot:scaffold230327_cov30-Tisochrysis_lutea.AAC.4